MINTRSWKVIAPALIQSQSDADSPSDAEIFGSTVWLWMQGPNHRNLPLHALDRLLLPAVRSQQFALVMETDAQTTRPVAYMAWANLSAKAESRYIASPLYGLNEDDWNSGDRMWCTEFFAPQSSPRRVIRLLAPLFARASFRYLSHRSNERGAKVFTFRGTQVDPAYARQWWRDRPMLAYQETAVQTS
jgi:cytolysin-activating lysine-acyltransferase